MTADLRRWEFGDPAKVVESREASKCNGCIHKAKAFGMWFCIKGRWTGINNEKKCKEFQGGTQ